MSQSQKPAQNAANRQGAADQQETLPGQPTLSSAFAPRPRTFVFLSYNHEDDPDAVVRLAELLKQDNVNVWLDKWELHGQRFPKAVEQAINQADTYLVFWGSKGEGQWQRMEIELATEYHISDGRPVIPVLLPGTGRLEKDKAKRFLFLNTWVDFRGKPIDDQAAYRELVCAIQGAPMFTSAERAAHQDACPYRGLLHFDIGDAHLFFGRENRTEWLLEELRKRSGDQSENRFVAIIGASGSGKSSLARAGLLASLQEGRLPGSELWPIVICRPGQRPLKELAVALCKQEATRAVAGDVGDLIERLGRERDRLDLVSRLAVPDDDPNRRVVLFVDQFEELFTLCTDEKERQAYVDSLWCAATETSGRAIVILTMRADFYGKCAAYPQLANLIGKHQELLPPMNDAELRRAIEIPASTCGVRTDPGLPEMLLRSMHGQVGALPLLQHALRQLWEEGRAALDGPELSMLKYLEMGELQGALERHADGVFDRLSGLQQEICRRLLCALTKLGDRTEDTKRRVPLSTLRDTCGDAEEVRKVVSKLADERLVTTTTDDDQGEALVEVAHEALIRGWSRLRGWLDADRDTLLVRQNLQEQVTEWGKHGRNADYLYAGGLLLKAEQWAQQHPGQLTPQEHDFLAASVGELIRRFVTVDLSLVPQFLAELEPYRERARDALRARLQDSSETSRESLYSSLALLPLDAGQVAFLRERLLTGDLAEFPLVRDHLLTNREPVIEWLWNALEQTGGEPTRRFRVSLALAAFDPPESSSTPARWETSGPYLAHRLVDAVAYNPAQYGLLVASVRPVRQLLMPPLTRIFREESDPLRRSWATNLLADLGSDVPETLAELTFAADAKQYAVLFDRLKSHQDRAIELADDELLQPAAPDATQEDREDLAKRQANAAVTLLRLDKRSTVWPLFRHSPDPRRRSYVVHRLYPMGVDSAEIIARLDVEPDVSARRALILTLGELFPAGEFSSEVVREGLSDRLSQLYRNDPDPGIHAAAEWVLRNWNQGERLARSGGNLATGKLEGDRQWYVNGQGQTLIVIPGPSEFLMGSPSTEVGRCGGTEDRTEQQHLKRIGRSFAIAAHTVTVEQFLRFRADHGYNKVYSPQPNCPVNTVTWYDAAAYCNWLSEQEGISQDQWCYEPDQRFGDGMRLPADYLQRTGYRLPSEAEWEYACRAGATTSRYYGETADLLGQYAWYTKNSLDRWMLPVGSFKPNDFGLFDMLGNALEWCQDKAAFYQRQKDGSASEDREDGDPARDQQSRVLRGGSFANAARFVRSATRSNDRPGYRRNRFGFRVARTLRQPIETAVPESAGQIHGERA